MQISCNATAGTSTVIVNAGPISTQTIATFINGPRKGPIPPIINQQSPK
jgi:hypothetical protein